MLELLYTFISLFLFLTDNISDVVIVFQDSNCKQDTNLPSDTISMTTSLQSQPAVRPQTGAKTFSTRHKNNIIDFSLKIISHLREKYGQNSFRGKQKFTIDGSPCWILSAATKLLLSSLFRRRKHVALRWSRHRWCAYAIKFH